VGRLIPKTIDRFWDKNNDCLLRIFAFVFFSVLGMFMVLDLLWSGIGQKRNERANTGLAYVDFLLQNCTQ